jgi:hypothetical protein
LTLPGWSDSNWASTERNSPKYISGRGGLRLLAVMQGIIFLGLRLARELMRLTASANHSDSHRCPKIDKQRYTIRGVRPPIHHSSVMTTTQRQMYARYRHSIAPRCSTIAHGQLRTAMEL